MIRGEGTSPAFSPLNWDANWDDSWHDCLLALFKPKLPFFLLPSANTPILPPGVSLTWRTDEAPLHTFLQPEDVTPHPGDLIKTKVLPLSLYLSLSLSLCLCLYLYQFNSIQGALLAWETYVNFSKASEVDNIQKWKIPYKWTVNITLTEVPKE